MADGAEVMGWLIAHAIELILHPRDPTPNVSAISST